MQSGRRLEDLTPLTKAGFCYVSHDLERSVDDGGATQPIVDRLTAEVQAALKEPAFLARLTGLGVTPIGKQPEVFAKGLAAEVVLYGDIVRSADLQVKADK